MQFKCILKMFRGPTQREIKHQQEGEKTTWSGDATRKMAFGMTDLHSSVTISVDEEDKTDGQAVKDRPIWMTESTIHTETNGTQVVCCLFKYIHQGR